MSRLFLIATALLVCSCSGSRIGGIGPGAANADADAFTGDSADASDVQDTALETGLDAVDSGPDTAADSETVELPPQAPTDLFSLGPPVEFQLLLSDQALTSLDTTPKEWVGAIAIIGGFTLEQPIQVRLGGEFGGERGLFEKTSLVIRFAEPFAGLSEVHLNNSVRDRSQMRGQVAYAMVRSMNLPAPRSTWAWVHINGAVYGLYGLEETHADPAFLAHWFGSNAGDIYRVGTDRADLTPNKVGDIARLTGDTSDLSALETLADALAAIDANVPQEDIMAALEGLFDMDSYLDYVATEIFLGHSQGYGFDQRHYAVHHGADGRWTFVGASMERAFRNIGNVFGGDGIVQKLCLRSLACRKELGVRLENTVVVANQNGLLGVALSARAVVIDAIEDDPKVESSVSQVTGSANQTVNKLVSWPPWMLAALACADPPSVDRDGDGYSGCTDDCNDENPDINPGMSETCNLVDDNCSGEIDDIDECPKCIPFTDSAGITYEFCFEDRNWVDSRDFCVSRGGDLASIHGAQTQLEVKDQAFVVKFDHWWIGFNDRDEEGVFVWSDGTPSDYDAWNNNEPNDSNGEDCGHLSTWGDGGWNDIPCSNGYPQICQLPP